MSAVAPTTTDVPPYSVAPRHAYPWWAPRFWHGMRLPAWFKLMARNRFAVSPSKAYLASSVTNAAMLNMFASVFDQLLMGHKVRATKLAEPPLFVLGHWRSGTTLMHELLILDDRHTYPNTYECFAPSHFLWTEWFVPPLVRWFLPEKRPMDNMPAGWERPQEDEFALCNMGIPSPYLAWAFPNHGSVNDDYLDLVSLSERDRNRWKAAFEKFVKRVAAVRNKRIILKSPTHTARVRTILEVFPDARFVHIVRNPLVLFPSTIRLWTTLSQVQGLQTVDGPIPWVEGHVLEQFVRMYERFEQDRELIPPGRLAEVRYEELATDPVGQMRQVYEQLDLGDFRRVKSAIATYTATHSTYKPNKYELPPATAERVRRQWAPYFERYGYAEEDANVALA